LLTPSVRPGAFSEALALARRRLAAREPRTPRPSCTVSSGRGCGEGSEPPPLVFAAIDDSQTGYASPSRCRQVCGTQHRSVSKPRAVAGQPREAQMIFVATKIVSDHIATVAVRTTASEIRWDRLMPQLQVGPDARATTGPATLACSNIVVRSGARSRSRSHSPDANPATQERRSTPCALCVLGDLPEGAPCRAAREYGRVRDGLVR